MKENIARNYCTLPVTCIGYFDSQKQLEDIMTNVKSHFNNIEWISMYHLGDTDDLKDHWHILIRNHSLDGRLNINKLQSFFEKEFQGEKKSFLFNSEFRQCKSVYSWYKYVLHDIDYLASKGESRNVHYKESDFHTNSNTFLKTVSEYKLLKEKSQYDLCVEYINQGLTDFDILQKLNLDLTQVHLAYKGLEIIRKLIF